MIDPRKPAEVRDAFFARLADVLQGHGFKPGKKAFVRNAGKGVVHRIEFAWNRWNVPGDVTCWISLIMKDKTIGPDWSAGTSFGHEPPNNIADSDQATALVSLLRLQLSFFDFFNNAPACLEEVVRRYVPGFTSPGVVVPFVRARLGEAAVRRYALALLEGRPELWPSFAGNPLGSVGPDHGAELARAAALVLPAPAGTAACGDLAAANLRDFFGLQLRAWGETDAAGSLRRIDDEGVHTLRAQFDRVPGPACCLEKARVTLKAVTGQSREPFRSAPRPQLFQYHDRHESFASS